MNKLSLKSIGYWAIIFISAYYAICVAINRFKNPKKTETELFLDLF